MKNHILKTSAITILLVLSVLLNLNAQQLLWKANFTGSGSNYPGKSVIDSENSIYVLGAFNSICDLPTTINARGGVSDIFIAKYDSEGTLLWVRSIGGPLTDTGTGIVVDNEYVYITGIFQNFAVAESDTIFSSGNYDGFLAKYKKDGGFVWIKRIASASLATKTQRPNEIKIDKYNHLIIGGIFDTEIKLEGHNKDTILATAQTMGMFIAQFDTSAALIKAKKIETSSSSAQFYTFEVDASGYYLCGYYGGNLITDLGTKVSNNSSLDMFVYKVNYSLDGMWIIQVGGSSDDKIFSCSVDKKGYLYLDGLFASPTLTVDSNRYAIPSQRIASNTTTDGKTDIFFAKYSSDGVLQWFNTLGSKQNDYLYRGHYNKGYFIAAGQYGDTLKFNGQTIAPKGNGDAFAVVVDENNTTGMLIPVTGTGAEIGETALVDNQSNFIVIGDYTSPVVTFDANSTLTNSNPGTRDMFVAKYRKTVTLDKTVTPVTCSGASNGAISVTPAGLALPPLTWSWSKTGDPSFSANTKDITGLNAGTYNVTLTDSEGYTVTDQVTLTNPAPVSVTLYSKTDVSCYNASDGTISINVSGGTAPYTYNWATTDGSGLVVTNKDQSTLAAGAYSVTVTDHNGCTGILGGLTITQPTPITVSLASKTDIICYSGSNGAISINVSGGNTPYTYTWATAGGSGLVVTNKDQSGITAGSYSVTVTDYNGCTGSLGDITVTQPASVSVSLASKTDVTCYNNSNGAISINVSGGNTPYTYAWATTGGSGLVVPNKDQSGLTAGSYSVTVTDLNGCTGVLTGLSVTQPEPVAVSLASKTNVTCHNGSNGAISINVSGGTLPYSYLWSTTDGSGLVVTGRNQSTLTAGNYSVTVTDLNGCTGILGDLPIAQPDQSLTITGIRKTDVSCYNGNNGALNASVSGGTPPYAYRWTKNGANYATTEDLSGLTSGDYALTITDFNNCTAYGSQSVISPQPISLSATVTPVTCENAGFDGAVTLYNPSGGTAPYTYQWSNGYLTQSISSLNVGTYTVTVTDSHGCTATLTRDVGYDAPITSNIRVTDISFSGNQTGQIDPGISGGHAPLTYQWSNGAATAVISGIPAGIYTLTVTDSRQCVKVLTATIHDLPSVAYLTSGQVPDTATQTVNTNLPVGATTGVFNVSPSGAATYSIPIACPPGLGNMKPNISVTYNSQSGNGLAGWGWNITGISAITRTPRTVYSDGYAKGLTVDTADRFALDGNRLISSSGVYGADHSTYRTENETFVHIVSEGAINNNIPGYFTVQDKSGNTYKYGVNSGHLNYSYTGQPGKYSILAWFLDFASDVNGNFITYGYEQRGLYTYLKKINYGCNWGDASCKSYNIDFIYKKRTDSIPVHFDKLKGSVDMLLDSVIVKNADTIYRAYKFEYTLDVFSKLVRITEINGIGENLNPTIIKWGADNKQVTLTNPTVATSYYKAFGEQSYLSADMNGDGLTDLVGVYPYDYSCGPGCTSPTNYAEVYKASSSPDGTVQFSSSGNYFDLGPNINVEFKSYLTGSISGDFDGDGKSDVIIPRYQNVGGSQIIFNVIKETGGGTTVQNLQASNEVPVYAVGDLNNDGKAEIVFIEKGTGDNFNYPGRMASSEDELWIDFNVFQSTTKPEKMLIVDFTGDGMADIMVLDVKGYRVYKNYGGHLAQAFLQSSGYNTEFTSDYHIRPGDFNGDGLPDLILNKKGENSKWELALNNGQGGFNLILLPGITVYDDKDTDNDNDKDNCIVTDFNNDGKSDMIIFDAFYNWDCDLFGCWKEFRDYTTYWYKSTGNNFELVKAAVSGNEAEAYNKYYVSGDFNGDGRTDIMNYGYDCYGSTDLTRNWKLYASFNNHFEGGMVTAVSDGMKRKSTITYSSIAVKDNYGVTNIPALPLMNISPSLYVVKQVDNTGGALGTLSATWSYKDAIFHPLKGFLGFGCFTTYNSAKKITVENYFSFDKVSGSEHFYLPYLTRTVTKVDNNPVQQTDLDYNLHTFGGKHIWMYQNSSTTTDLLKKIKVTASQVFDTDGNLTSTEVKNINAVDNAVTATKKVSYNNYADRITTDDNSFSNGPENITTEQTHVDDPGNTSTDTTLLEYNSNGSLKKKTAFAGRSKSVTTDYVYFTNGNLKSETVSASGVEPRTASYTYHASGRFPASRQNALNHKTEYSYDNFGRLTMQKDLNGAVTTFKYDKWGALTEKTTPADKTTVYHLGWANGGDAPANALYYADVVHDGNFAGAKYFDFAGNLLRKVTTGYNGTRYYNDNEYASYGEIIDAWEPYRAGSSAAKKSRYVYDHLNRLLSHSLPDGVVIYYTYTDNTVTMVYNAIGWNIKTYDAAGLLKQVTDEGGVINYLYNSMGKSRRIESPGSVTEMSYNAYGLQDALIDPDAGTTTYEYNAFGELTSQVNSKGSSAITYDKLGRVKTRTTAGVTTTYTYDEGTRALGTLTRISSSGGAGESYVYSTDGLCLIREETRSNSAQSFTYKYDYDENYRVRKLTYPAGFALNYTYDAYDNLTAIHNAATSDLIWQIDAVNERNQLQSTTWGNGKQITYGYDSEYRLNRIYAPEVIDFNYNFNLRSQLMHRDEKYYESSAWKGFREDFSYDNLDRFTSASIGSNILSVNYDSTLNDRIKYKSDIGTYIYHPNAHRLDSIRQVYGSPLPNHTIHYNAEGKTDTLKEGNKMLCIEYGIDNQRFKTSYSVGGTNQYTRYYFNTYEKEIMADGTTRDLSYIYAGGALVAINVQKGGTDSTFYVYTDYLGSLRCITDADGNVVQRLSFDAWGNRRDPLTGTKLAAGANFPSFGGIEGGRGFTGHEHLDEFGLINMNGRIYDPSIGMFVSPDNYVQAPDFTQNFNRYTYGLNNPLKYTDPDGEFWHIVIGAAVGGIINVACNWNQIDGFWEGLASFGAGAASGAMTAAWGPWGALAGGALTGATNNLVAQTDQNFSGFSNVDWGQVGLNTGVGGVSGIVGYGVGRWAGQNIGGVVLNGTQISANSAIGQGITGAIGGAAGGYASGFTAGYLMTGDLSVANRSGINGMGMGAGIGFTTGFASGLKYSFDNDLDPLTGKSNYKSPNVKGEEGVMMAIQDIKLEGGEILATQVTVEVNGVRIKVDIVANIDGRITLVEVKNGPNAGYTPNQKIAIPDIIQNKPSIIPRGGNATMIPQWQVGQPFSDYNFQILKY